MSKLNIIFNNTNYSIDESAISTATADLRTHLSTVMNGTGATIEFGGTTYNIDAAKLSAAEDNFASYLNNISGEITESERLEGDGAEYYTLAPTALSFRSTAPLNELQEVQINGVTVDPANYTLEEGSTIVTFPIEYLKTLNVGDYEVTIVSDSKTVKGDFVVAAPVLNGHGFYYNQPYSANLPMFGGDIALFVHEDGTYDIITVGKIPDTGEYTMNGNNIVATHPLLGTITCTISSDGTSVYCNEVGANFELSGSTAIAADDDYVYVYMEELGGYEVTAINKTKAEYGPIKTGINGIDTVKLADRAFVYYVDALGGIYGNAYTTSMPEIPSTVTIIGIRAFTNCDKMQNIIIPSSVRIIEDEAFVDCDLLTNVVIPGSVTSIGASAFESCMWLMSMTFEGTVSQWNAITKGYDWNRGVPATHVQCTDGTVAL